MLSEADTYDFNSEWDNSISNFENETNIREHLKAVGLLNKPFSKEEIKDLKDTYKEITKSEDNDLKQLYTPQTNSINFKEIFNKPKIIGICGGVNSGKSNLINYLILNLKDKANIYSYGNKKSFKGVTDIYSIDEMEQVRDSIIFLDEIMSLWDLDNRHEKRIIEKSLRLINHRNNILIICGVEDSFRKFIASKIDTFIFKKVKICDFINGCRAKNVVMAYRGNENGSTILNLEVDEALVFNGTYSKINIPYVKSYDTKLNNPMIVKENVINCVQENVREKLCNKKCNNLVIKDVINKEETENVDYSK